jgi:hypothetical protein
VFLPSKFSSKTWGVVDIVAEGVVSRNQSSKVWFCREERSEPVKEVVGVEVEKRADTRWLRQRLPEMYLLGEYISLILHSLLLLSYPTRPLNTPSNPPYPLAFY